MTIEIKHKRDGAAHIVNVTAYGREFEVFAFSLENAASELCDTISSMVGGYGRFRELFPTLRQDILNLDAPNNIAAKIVLKVKEVDRAQVVAANIELVAAENKAATESASADFFPQFLHIAKATENMFRAFETPKILVVLCIFAISAAYANHWQDVRYDRELAAIEADRLVFNSDLAFLKEGK